VIYVQLDCAFRHTSSVTASHAAVTGFAARIVKHGTRTINGHHYLISSIIWWFTV